MRLHILGYGVSYGNIDWSSRATVSVGSANVFLIAISSILVKLRNLPFIITQIYRRPNTTSASCKHSLEMCLCISCLFIVRRPGLVRLGMRRGKSGFTGACRSQSKIVLASNTVIRISRA